MNSTVEYIKKWQDALQMEIQHLQKFGGKKYVVKNGIFISEDAGYQYYFETQVSLPIPPGSMVKLEWGGLKQEGRVLSSDGRSIIISFEKTLGDLISEAFLYYDPWDLLEQLIERLEETKKSKKRRIRIKRLMDPSMAPKHPAAKAKSNVQELFLRSKYNPVTYVWGPPGTGKTYTLARTAANHYFKDKRVLILSHSNQAVDVLMAEVSAFVKNKNRFKEGELIRYGAQTGELIVKHNDILTESIIEKQSPDLTENKQKLFEEKRLLKLDLSESFSKRDSEKLIGIEQKLARAIEKIRQKETELLKEAKLIGTTLAKASVDAAIYETEFDVIILDEASMAYVPQAGFAATLGNHIIVSGDFKQLPPISVSRNAAAAEWLKDDIFHKSGVADSVNRGVLHPHLFLLKEQRRMHPDISAFTNRYIYHSLVTDHKSVISSRNDIVKQAPFPNLASVLLDSSFTGDHSGTEKTSKSRNNPWHLLLSFQLIHEAYLSGIRSIGYVSPYRSQATLMDIILNDLYEAERMDADIISATVHKFQGSERDCMIFDSVDSYPQDRAGMLLTGKDSERLINVAITRTKGKFIHVANTSFILNQVYPSKTLRKLVDYQQNHNQVIPQRDIGTWIKHMHPRLKWMHAKKLDLVFQDIRNARKSISMALPKAMLTDQWKQQLNERRGGVKLSIRSSLPLTGVQADQWIEESHSYPYILIDGQFFWLGLPLETMKGVQPPHVAVRLDSEAFCSQFLNSR